MRHRSMGLVALGGLLSLPSIAFAHLELEQPVSRYGRNVQKNAPCGQTGGARTTNVTTYRPGQQIVVRWNEFINHPGHYRIAFDPDGDDTLTSPACLAGCDTTTPTIERDTAGVMVLLDGIADGTATATVTLPNMTCTNCTLQIIQVMYDKPPYLLPGDDVYFQCADIVLSDVAVEPDAGVPALDATVDVLADGGVLGQADAAVPEASDSGAGSTLRLPPNTVAGDSEVDGTACAVGGRPDFASWMPLALTLVFIRLRRRRSH